MTIALSDNTPRISYTVNQGVTQTSFTVPFIFFDGSTDINVFVDNVARTYSATTSNTTLFTVAGGSGSTGTVTTTVTGATGGSTVIITRDVPLARTTDFPSSGAFEIAKLNTELDTLLTMITDADDENSRALRLQDSDSAVNLTLPLKADRLGTVLGFNATTGAVEAGPTIANVSSLTAITGNINTLGGISADITTVAHLQDGTTATNAISNLASITTAISGVNAISTEVQQAYTDRVAIQNASTNATNAADSASAAAASAAAAALSADTFDDTYLGAKPIDPSDDNDGDALNAGDLYFNTTSNNLKVYTGSAWADAALTAANFLTVANNLSDLNNAGTARTNLGLGTIATQAANSVSITGGSVTGITDLTVADGGTGASSASAARTNLGLVIGTDVQAYDADNAVLDTDQTFTGDITFSGTSKVQQTKEKMTISATAATGTINYDALTQAVLYYTTNASANWTVNVRGDGSNTLNSIMSIGESLTVVFLVTQGTTAYYNSAFQVDGSSVTPKWQGGDAPSEGTASGIDAYTYTIIKTADATFTVLASVVDFS